MRNPIRSRSYSVVQALIIGGLLAWAAPASAANLVIDTGILLGATNVDVDGELYDVEFVDGTCASVYGVCDETAFAFTDETSATAAAQALLEQVFISSFDTNPALTFGCGTATTGCTVLTAYLVSATTVFVVRTNNFSGSTNDTVASDTVLTTFDTSSSGRGVYARWTRVPEPGTLLLLGVGLTAVGLRNRRHPRRPAS